MELLLVLNKHRVTPYCSACCIEQLGVHRALTREPATPTGDARACCLLPIVLLMTSSQELDTNSFQTLFSGLIARWGAKTQSQREAGHHAVLERDWLPEGNVYQEFTVIQGEV